MLGVTDGDGVRPERASDLVVLDGRASGPQTAVITMRCTEVAIVAGLNF